MKKVLGRIFVLWLPLVGIIWLGISLVFWLLTHSAGGLPESMIMIKPMLNWILGICALLSIILIPAGIIMLSSSSKTGEYISLGRKLAKKNLGQYWLPLVVIFLIMVLNNFIKSKGASPITTSLTIINWIVSFLYGIGLVKLGLQAGDEDKKFSVKTLFDHKWSEIWKSFVAPLVFGLMMILPALFAGGLLIVGFLAFGSSALSQLPATMTQNPILQNPEVSGMLASFGSAGLWVGVLLTLIGLVVVCYLVYVSMRVTLVIKYVAIDHNDLGIWGMIKHSRNITKGKVWRIFVVGFLAGLTNILGILTLGIGLLWTIPLTLIATAKIYQDVDKEYKKEEKFGG